MSSGKRKRKSVVTSTGSVKAKLKDNLKVAWEKLLKAEMVKKRGENKAISASAKTKKAKKNDDIDKEPKKTRHSIPGINEGRPPHPHRTVLMCAIYGSLERKLTLKELKMALQIHFPSYAKEDQNAGWLNSILHALSRDPAFSRIERPGKDYTKGGDQGSWWTLTFVGPPDVTPISRGLDQIKPTEKRQVDSSPEPQAIFESSPRMERQTPDRAALQYTRSWNNLNSYPPVPSLYPASQRTAPIFSSHPNASFPLPCLQTTGLLEVEKWVPRNAILPPRSRKSIDDELLRTLTRPQETIWRKEYSPSDSE
ncbi:hypothetical protein M422DRAFT_777651 [Sphaerobolus stellatus SS14]|nr:hypothetical protein M422DRAFT_777651 [Sphaerobolus stellatus SS14]